MTYRHIFTSDKRYDLISGWIRESYPHACIIEIKEVFNHIDFVIKFEESAEALPGHKIVQLFHGTDEDSVRNIINEGFLVERNYISALGKGTYFSSSASISKGYALKNPNRVRTKQKDLLYIIVADVIIDDVQNSGTGKIPSCYVDSLTRPNIYCIPHDNRALPKYVVSFCENGGN